MEHEVLLMDALVNPHTVPHFVSYAILTTIILMIVTFIVRSSIKLVPRGTQNFMEIVMEALLKLCEDNIGHHWARPLFPMVATIFIWIAVGNLMGLIPGFAAPTSNVNTNFAMAFPVFLLTHYLGLKVHKGWYINHFLGPIRQVAAIPMMIMMLIIETISHCVRPLTLTIRLFGNMNGKHYMLLVLGIIAPILVPSVILAMGVMVSALQAFIFTILTCLYFAGAVEHAH